MEKRLIQYALAVTAAGILIYIARKKIIDHKKRKRDKKIAEEYSSKQARRSKDYYGEYTL